MSIRYLQLKFSVKYVSQYDQLFHLNLKVANFIKLLQIDVFDLFQLELIQREVFNVIY